ncbi:MAG: dTDP-4-dehydrorhamnose 3,5-epimerase [Burkholderiales bacterium]
MEVTETGLPGVLRVRPRVFEDARGCFFESFNARALATAGIPGSYVQDNQSKSMRGVLRGLHYQAPRAQGKLVRVLSGEIFDVVVDLRRASPAFGRWQGTRLSADNRESLWIPEGCAHGFLVVADSAEVLYKTTDYYAPADEHCLLWNDPALGIHWPLTGAPIVSDKDRAGRPLADAVTFA